MSHKSAVCVGGPLSGKRYAILYGAGFMVPTTQPEEVKPWDKDYKPNEAVPVEFHYYKAETFHTPQGDVSFWTPKEQTPLQSITILLEAFERAANPTR